MINKTLRPLLLLAFMAFSFAATARPHQVNLADYLATQPDDTAAFQAAIDSGARKILIPNPGRDYSVAPLLLTDNQTLQFEPGVRVVAKPGTFPSKHDALFTALAVRNCTIQGSDTVFAMNRDEYPESPMESGSGRHILAFWGCGNITVSSVTLQDAGLNGIAILSAQNYPGLTESENILIENCRFQNCRRGGVIIASVKGLTLSQCAFEDCGGMDPGFGIEVAPISAMATLDDIRIQNCTAKGNLGGHFLIDLGTQIRGWNHPQGGLNILAENNLFQETNGIGILVQNCYTLAGLQAQYPEGGRRPGYFDGTIRIRETKVQNAAQAGVAVYDRALTANTLTFENCQLQNVALDWESSSDKDRKTAGAVFEPRPIWPFYVYHSGDELVNHHGDINFVNCRLEDNFPRPLLWAEESHTTGGVQLLTGHLILENRHAQTPYLDLGPRADFNTLTVEVITRVMGEIWERYW